MGETQNDAAWVKAYQKGNERAFKKLYARYERPLFSFILKTVRNRQNAEDLFQKTWIKVIRALPDYEERGTFSSWLFGIAHNACIDLLRQKQRAKVDDFASDEGFERMPGDGPDPARLMETSEMKACLEASIDQLPPDQKAVVLLRLYAEMPFKEIAELMEAPLNTILGRMHYAVNNLRKIMTQKMGEDLDYVLS